METTVPLKGGYMGFHVSLGECIFVVIIIPLLSWLCSKLPFEQQACGSFIKPF